MKYSYIIIDDDPESVSKTKEIAAGFLELNFVASATNYTEALNVILEHKPQLIFLEIDPLNPKSDLSLALINELYRYLKIIPKVIVTTTKKELAFEAIQFEVSDYLLKPIQRIDLLKSILKLNKSLAEEEIFVIQNSNSHTPTNRSEENNPAFLPLQQPKQEQTQSASQSLVICIKSYGDYRYIDAKDICYFQADNNSTDIHLNNGEMITAFKTLKHFEGVLPFPFVRIHNSYIVNRTYISRLHTGNAVCYIKNTTTKLPFSKSYKANVDLILADFSNGNYLEI